jgi:hypothetical protein
MFQKPSHVRLLPCVNTGTRDTHSISTVGTQITADASVQSLPSSSSFFLDATPCDPPRTQGCLTPSFGPLPRHNLPIYSCAKGYRRGRTGRGCLRKVCVGEKGRRIEWSTCPASVRWTQQETNHSCRCLRSSGSMAAISHTPFRLSDAPSQATANSYHI